MEKIDGSWEVIGVLSYPLICNDVPEMYTLIHPYLEWIKENI